MSDPFPHVQTAGTAVERGRQYGEQARDRIRRSIAAYQQIFERYAGWSWRRVREEARRYIAPISDFGPKFLGEIEGIARGAALDLEDILALNVRTEIMFSAKAREAAKASRPTPARECTSMVVGPSATTDGHTLIGQNWDWFVHAFETVVVVEAQQCDGPSFVTVAEAGMLAKTGMNAAGIGLATNALVCEDDIGEPGVPYHVLLRAVLDAEHISDAVGAIQGCRRASSANYLIAQRDGLAVSVEAMPGDYSRIDLLHLERGFIFHTNHFLCPRADRKDVTLWLSPDSLFRLQRARELVGHGSAPVDVPMVQRAFTDHVNHPYGVCFHPDPRINENEREASVTSVIMDLNASLIWLSDGQPCETGYRELDYSGLLTGSSHSFTQRPLLTG